MGWNIKEAALACGVAHSTWRHWELDGKEPQNYVETVERISARTRCDYGWLLDGATVRVAERPLEVPSARHARSSDYRLQIPCPAGAHA